MKNIYIISIVVFIMLSCMASSPQHSLQSRLFGTWAASDDKVAVFQIDKDSLYYIDEDPIVAISYKFAGDSMSLDYWGALSYNTSHFARIRSLCKTSWARLVVLYLLNNSICMVETA